MNKFHIIAVLAGIVLTLISFSHLLVDTDIIIDYRDLRVYPTTQMTLEQTSYTWDDKGSGFDVQSISRFWFGIFSLGFITAAARIRLIFFVSFVLTFILAYFSFFIISKRLFKSSELTSFVVAMTAAAIYLYNINFIISLMPPTYYIISYLTFPVLLLCMLMYLEKKETYYIILSALLITLMFTATPRYIILLFVILASFAFGYLCFSNNKKETFLSLLKYWLYMLPMLFVLNLYWTIPFLISGGGINYSPPYVNSYEITSMLSNFDLKGIITLTDTFWPMMELKPLFWEPLFNALFYALPICAVLALLFWRDYNKHEKIFVLSGSVMLLIGFFLYKGINNINPIMSAIYEFLNLGTPSSIGWMFRGPGYFAPILMFAYLVNITVLINHFLNKPDKAMQKWGFIIAAALVCCTFIGSWQAFTGDFSGILESGYYADDAQNTIDVNYTRAVFPIGMNEHRIGRPFLDIRNDFKTYLVSKAILNDTQTIDFMLGSMAADAFIVKSRDISPIFENFSGLRQNASIYVTGKNVSEFFVPSEIIGITSFDLKVYEKLGYLGDGISFASIKDAENFTDIIMDPVLDDFVLLNSESVLLIPVFGYGTHEDINLYWSKAMTSDMMHGDWHSHLIRFNILNWQSDNGAGLLFTTGKNVTEKINVDVAKAGDYRLFVKYFSNQKGGQFDVYFNNNILNVSSIGDSNEFKWMDLGVFNLRSGSHELTFKNIYGFNAIILFALVPPEEYDSLLDDATASIPNKTVIYSIKPDIGSSDFVTYNFSTYSGVNYRASVFDDGIIGLLIDGKQIKNESMYLDAGEHEASMFIINGSRTGIAFVYASDTNKTLDEMINHKLPASVVGYDKKDPTEYKVHIDASEPFVLAFAEAYSPLWEAKIYKNDKQVGTSESFRLNGVINGFWINETGELTVVLKHIQQNYFEFFLAISGIAFLIALVYIAFRLKGAVWK